VKQNLKLSSNYLNKKDVIMNQCIRLSQSLVTFSNFRPIREINLSLVGVQSILGNLRSVNTPILFLIYLDTELKQLTKNCSKYRKLSLKNTMVIQNLS